MSDPSKFKVAAERRRETQKAGDTLHSASKEAGKITLYMKRDMIHALKTRAWEEGTSASQIVAELVTQRLAEPVRKPGEPERRRVIR